MYNIAVYVLALVLLAVSWHKNKQKTKLVFKKAGKSFMNILPEMLSIIIFIGVVLAVMDAETISSLVGAESGVLGLVLSAVVGAITLIPAFIAFPTAAMLLEGGAGTLQIAVFISTLMMVGVATAPLEIRYFGRRFTLVRNGLAFAFSFVIAYFVYWVVGV
ncbi:MAG: permease [Firmicutes bacterium]|nr:permease [Bacillota bacterium]